MMKNKIKRAAYKALHGFLCFLIIFNQIAPTYAQSITVDGGAPASNQANLTTAPNGVPVVNIVTPNGAGVSHNQFTDYNVTNQGLILNNSSVVGVSQLGGAMIGNPNVAGGTANLIINEVTSANSSSLQGATEVFGPATNVIVANPNGISCNGCGFINTPKATLTTGTPQLNGAGALSNISVNNGTITIQGTGLEVTGNNKAEILSRAIEINGDIHAGEINLVTGRNDINASGVVTPKAPDASIKPALAIDSSALGGMYAGKITLIGTESGVGFKLDGDMAASTTDLVIINDGKIQMKNASANRDVKITTTGTSDIDINGILSSNDNTVLRSSGDINLSSDTIIESKGPNTQLKANNIITNSQGLILGYGDISINALQLVNNKGAIIAGEDIKIEGVTSGTATSVFDNLEGFVESTNGDIFIDADILNNIGNAQVETDIASYWFQVRGTRVPGWIPVVGISPEGHAQLYDGDTNSYVFAAHPDFVQTIVEDSGQSLDDFYDAANNRYIFNVSEWLALAPSNASTLINELDRWALFAPEDVIGSYIISQSYVDRLLNGTKSSSEINSRSGNVHLNIETELNNTVSIISSAQDLLITGNGALNNNALDLRKRIVQRTSGFGNAQVREIGWGTWFSFTTAVQISDTLLDTVPSVFAAGGSNTINLAGDVVSVSSNASNVTDFDFGGVSSGVIRSKLQTGNKQATIFNNTALAVPATDTNFLYETRFDFTNLGTFFGSDYFLNGVLGGYDPNSISKRLGDAYIDSRYITEQVIAQSGRKYLDTAFGSDTDQVKALLDRGIAANTALNLTPLIALTVEQQNALTQDIVWYEERVINGETIIVPQLYLASATLDAQGQKLRGSTISGRNVNLIAENVNLSMGRITALEDINVSANDSIVIQSGVVDGTNVSLGAGNDIILTTRVAGIGNGITEIGSNKNLTGLIEATNDVNLTAGELAAVIGADVNAGNDLNIGAKNVSVDALTLQSGFDRGMFQGGNLAVNQVEQDGANLSAGNNLNINALENIRVRGSNASAGNDINIDALTGSVLIDAAEESSYSRGKSETRDHTIMTRTHQASELSTESGDINIKSTLGNVTLKAAELDSGNDINLEATTGSVALLTEKDYDFEDNTKTKSNAVWQSYENKGHEIETIRHTILTGEGELNIIAANGVEVEYQHTGNLDADIAQLSQAPELAWMAALKDGPNVNFKAVEATYREWHEEHEGLSGPAAAVIAIAVAVATQGMGAGLVGLSTTSTAGLATSAGFSALVSQATISLINNKGNLGDVFQELASADTVRNVAAAALTAGFLDQANVSNLDLSSDFFAADAVLTNIQDQLIASGIRSGVDSVVTGADFSDTLKNNLRFAGAAVLGTQLSQEIGNAFRENNIDRTAQLIAHAATGCAAGLVGTGNCQAGAAGQLAGEITSILHGDYLINNSDALVENWATQNIDIARLSGAIAAALAGGSAIDVNLGSQAGGIAAANNNLSILLQILVKGGKLLKSSADDIAKNSAKLGKKIDIDDLLKAGQQMDKNGLTKAGRAIQKHGDRVGSKFPQVKGSAKLKNEQGQKILDNIVSNPKSSYTYKNHDTLGKILDIRAPNGQGARFSSDGKKLIGLLD